MVPKCSALVVITNLLRGNAVWIIRCSPRFRLLSADLSLLQLALISDCSLTQGCFPNRPVVLIQLCLQTKALWRGVDPLLGCSAKFVSATGPVHRHELNTFSQAAFLCSFFSSSDAMLHTDAMWLCKLLFYLWQMTSIKERCSAWGSSFETVVWVWPEQNRWSNVERIVVLNCVAAQKHNSICACLQHRKIGQSARSSDRLEQSETQSHKIVFASGILPNGWYAAAFPLISLCWIWPEHANTASSVVHPELIGDQSKLHRLCRE